MSQPHSAPPTDWPSDHDRRMLVVTIRNHDQAWITASDKSWAEYMADAVIRIIHSQLAEYDPSHG